MAMTTTKESATERALLACGVPLDQVPAVRSAAAAMAETATNEAKKEATLLRFEQVLDPNRRAGDGATISVDEVFEARANVVAARIEHAQAVRDARRARASYEAAVVAEKGRRLDVVRAAKRAVAQRLLAALTAIRDQENRDAMLLDEAERGLCGGAVANALAWRELTNEARLDAWTTALRADGLLD